MAKLIDYELHIPDFRFSKTIHCKKLPRVGELIKYNFEHQHFSLIVTRIEHKINVLYRKQEECIINVFTEQCEV